MTRIPGIIGQYVTAGGPTGLHTAYTHYIHQTPTPVYGALLNNGVKQKNRLKRYSTPNLNRKENTEMIVFSKLLMNCFAIAYKLKGTK
jgi:hypothetical protein